MSLCACLSLVLVRSLCFSLSFCLTLSLSVPLCVLQSAALPQDRDDGLEHWNWAVEPAKAVVYKIEVCAFFRVCVCVCVCLCHNVVCFRDGLAVLLAVLLRVLCEMRHRVFCVCCNLVCLVVFALRFLAVS